MPWKATDAKSAAQDMSTEGVHRRVAEAAAIQSRRDSYLFNAELEAESLAALVKRALGAVHKVKPLRFLDSCSNSEFCSDEGKCQGGKCHRLYRVIPVIL